MHVIALFGSRTVTTTAGRGRFHCPQCGGAQEYRRRKVTRCAALFTLPVLPLERLGEYVECSMCSGTFEPDVLDRDPDAALQPFEALYKRMVRELMVRMLVADGRIEEPELDVIVRLYPKLTGEMIERERIEEEAERVIGDGRLPLGSVRASAPFLNGMGKATMIRAALWVAGADGTLAEAEVEFLSELAEALGLSRRRLREVLHGDLGD